MSEWVVRGGIRMAAKAVPFHTLKTGTLVWINNGNDLEIYGLICVVAHGPRLICLMNPAATWSITNLANGAYSRNVHVLAPGEKLLLEQT